MPYFNDEYHRVDHVIKSVCGLKDYSPFNNVVWEIREISINHNDKKYNTKLAQDLQKQVMEKYEVLEFDPRKNLEISKDLLNKDPFEQLLKKSMDLKEYAEYLLNQEKELNPEQKENIDSLLSKIEEDKREIYSEIVDKLVEEVYDVLGNFILFGLCLPNLGSFKWISKPNFNVVKIKKDLYFAMCTNNLFPKPIIIKIYKDGGEIIDNNNNKPLYESVLEILEQNLKKEILVSSF